MTCSYFNFSSATTSAINYLISIEQFIFHSYNYILFLLKNQDKKRAGILLPALESTLNNLPN
jgi:hypothetical protein